MKQKIIIISFVAFLAIGFSAWQAISHRYMGEETKGLKDYYQNYFTIGVAVSPRALKTDEAELILKHFNSMTAENAMKMGPIHPKENEYNWAGADSIAAFARRNN
ncbi:MAG: endo-1,4-beta-xylanase, partial [Chitinophagaceae bacterium]|nr:endo-1,4-beta-xylanase [Chitinophagaceae bacterium]